MKKKLGTLLARFLRAHLRNSLIFSLMVECGARTHEAFGTQARLSNALVYNGLNIYFAVSKVCQMTQY